MRILPYYIIHTFINSIKKLFKTWVAVFIGIIILFSLIGGIIGGIAGSVIDSKIETSSGTNEGIYEEIQEEHTSGDEISEDNFALILGCIEMAVGGIALLVILLNIYNGDKSGAAIFTMPDVNFLFASPMQPQSILMFRTVLKMGLALVSSFYLLFQLPNLVLNAGLSLSTCLFILLAWVMILFIGNLASVFTYTITATHSYLRKYIRPFVIGVVIIIAAVYFVTLKYTGDSYLNTGLLLFASNNGRFIPVFGWLRGMVMSAANGDYLYSSLYFILLAASCALLSYLIWKIKADFYEDALSGAAKVQEALETAKTGVAAQRKKDRSEKISRNSELRGLGAKVFFTKTIYNRKRFAKFGILTSTCGTYILLSLFFSFITLRFIPEAEAYIAGSVLLIAVFFRCMGNPAAGETQYNFIFTVPESPYKKIYYILLSGVWETALDLLPAVIIIEIMLKANIFYVILGYLLLISLDLFCSSVGLFIEIILPTLIVPTIKAMLQMMLRMTAIIPGIIILAIGASISHILLGILITTIVNVAVSAFLFAITPGFLHLGKS